MPPATAAAMPPATAAATRPAASRAESLRTLNGLTTPMNDATAVLGAPLAGPPTPLTPIRPGTASGHGTATNHSTAPNRSTTPTRGANGGASTTSATDDATDGWLDLAGDKPERHRAMTVDRLPRYANQVHRPASRGMIAAVVSVVLFLLVVLPGYLVLRSGSDNPSFDALDNLDLPSWASVDPQDHTSGDRWCVSQCLKSDRIAQSTKTVDETSTAYAAALRSAGWTPAPTSACTAPAPHAALTCWVHDAQELVVNLSPAECALDPQPTSEAVAPDPSATDLRRIPPPAGCAQTAVTVSVFDKTAIQTGDR